MDGEVYTFFLPDIGEGVVEGEVLEWLKKEGESVIQDEPVVVVMTDKATVELPSPHPGIIKKHYYQPGQIAIKDKPLYDLVLHEGSSKIGVKSEKISNEEEKINQKAIKDHTPSVSTETVLEKSKSLAIPKVRHLAKKMDVDLNVIVGTGFEGRITENDLQNYVKKSEKKEDIYSEGDVKLDLLGIRGLMAKKMDQAHIPQFSYFEKVDSTRLIQLRQNIKKKAYEEGIHLSFMPFFIRALSLTIRQFPQLNASINMQEKQAILHTQQHIGIAMSSAQGLIVPVLKNVELMNLTELIKAYEKLKVKAISNKLTSMEMKRATMTISNFGVFEGEGMWATPMISDPQVAILAIAKMRKMAVVKEDQVTASDILPLSWSFDHRLIDGDLAAKISHCYCSFLKNPASLL